MSRCSRRRRSFISSGPVNLPLVEALRQLGFGPEEARTLTVAELARALEGAARKVTATEREESETATAKTDSVTSAVTLPRYAQSNRCIPLLLRVRDAAAMLAISERAVWQLIRSDQLRPIHPAGMRATRIARGDVEALSLRWRAASERGLRG